MRARARLASSRSCSVRTAAKGDSPAIFNLLTRANTLGSLADQPIDDVLADGTLYKGTGKFEGKVWLITGGDSGIGRSAAILAAYEGANV